MQDVASPVEWLRWTYCLSCRSVVQVTAAPDPGAGKQQSNTIFVSKRKKEVTGILSQELLARRNQLPEV